MRAPGSCCCLALPAAFTQPGDHLLAEPCISTFQKGSPYIQDVNRLIGLSGQMGMMDVAAFLANSTKCDMWSEIKASHKAGTTHK